MKLSTQLKRWRGVSGRGRQARGRFDQAAAAAQLGTSLRTYQDWEQGRSTPRGLALSTVLERIKG